MGKRKTGQGQGQEGGQAKKRLGIEPELQQPEPEDSDGEPTNAPEGELAKFPQAPWIEEVREALKKLRPQIALTAWLRLMGLREDDYRQAKAVLDQGKWTLKIGKRSISLPDDDPIWQRFKKKSLQDKTSPVSLGNSKVYTDALQCLIKAFPALGFLTKNVGSISTAFESLALWALSEAGYSKRLMKVARQPIQRTDVQPNGATATLSLDEAQRRAMALYAHAWDGQELFRPNKARAFFPIFQRNYHLTTRLTSIQQACSNAKFVSHANYLEPFIDHGRDKLLVEMYKKSKDEKSGSSVSELELVIIALRTLPFVEIIGKETLPQLVLRQTENSLPQLWVDPSFGKNQKKGGGAPAPAYQLPIEAFYPEVWAQYVKTRIETDGTLWGENEDHRLLKKRVVVKARGKAKEIFKIQSVDIIIFRNVLPKAPPDLLLPKPGSKLTTLPRALLASALLFLGLDRRHLVPSLGKEPSPFLIPFSAVKPDGDIPEIQVEGANGEMTTTSLEDLVAQRFADNPEAGKRYLKALRALLSAYRKAWEILGKTEDEDHKNGLLGFQKITHLNQTLADFDKHVASKVAASKVADDKPPQVPSDDELPTPFPLSPEAIVRVLQACFPAGPNQDPPPAVLAALAALRLDSRYSKEEILKAEVRFDKDKSSWRIVLPGVDNPEPPLLINQALFKPILDDLVASRQTSFGDADAAAHPSLGEWRHQGERKPLNLDKLFTLASDKFAQYPDAQGYRAFFFRANRELLRTNVQAVLTWSLHAKHQIDASYFLADDGRTKNPILLNLLKDSDFNFNVNGEVTLTLPVKEGETAAKPLLLDAPTQALARYNRELCERHRIPADTPIFSVARQTFNESLGVTRRGLARLPDPVSLEMLSAELLAAAETFNLTVEGGLAPRRIATTLAMIAQTDGAFCGHYLFRRLDPAKWQTAAKALWQDALPAFAADGEAPAAFPEDRLDGDRLQAIMQRGGLISRNETFQEKEWENATGAREDWEAVIARLLNEAHQAGQPLFMTPEQAFALPEISGPESTLPCVAGELLVLTPVKGQPGQWQARTPSLAPDKRFVVTTAALAKEWVDSPHTLGLGKGGGIQMRHPGGDPEHPHPHLAQIGTGCPWFALSAALLKGYNPATGRDESGRRLITQASFNHIALAMLARIDKEKIESGRFTDDEQARFDEMKAKYGGAGGEVSLVAAYTEYDHWRYVTKRRTIENPPAAPELISLPLTQLENPLLRLALNHFSSEEATSAMVVCTGDLQADPAADSAARKQIAKDHYVAYGEDHRLIDSLLPDQPFVDAGEHIYKKAALAFRQEAKIKRAQRFFSRIGLLPAIEDLFQASGHAVDARGLTRMLMTRHGLTIVRGNIAGLRRLLLGDKANALADAAFQVTSHKLPAGAPADPAQRDYEAALKDATLPALVQLPGLTPRLVYVRKVENNIVTRNDNGGDISLNAFIAAKRAVQENQIDKLRDAAGAAAARAVLKPLDSELKILPLPPENLNAIAKDFVNRTIAMRGEPAPFEAVLTVGAMNNPLALYQHAQSFPASQAQALTQALFGDVLSVHPLGLVYRLTEAAWNRLPADDQLRTKSPNALTQSEKTMLIESIDLQTIHDVLAGAIVRDPDLLAEPAMQMPRLMTPIKKITVPAFGNLQYNYELLLASFKPSINRVILQLNGLTPRYVVASRNAEGTWSVIRPNEGETPLNAYVNELIAKRVAEIDAGGQDSADKKAEKMKLQTALGETAALALEPNFLTHHAQIAVAVDRYLKTCLPEAVRNLSPPEMAPQVLPAAHADQPMASPAPPPGGDNVLPGQADQTAAFDADANIFFGDQPDDFNWGFGDEVLPAGDSFLAMDLENTEKDLDWMAPGLPAPEPAGPSQGDGTVDPKLLRPDYWLSDSQPSAQTTEADWGEIPSEPPGLKYTATVQRVIIQLEPRAGEQTKNLWLKLPDNALGLRIVKKDGAFHVDQCWGNPNPLMSSAKALILGHARSAGDGKPWGGYSIHDHSGMLPPFLLGLEGDPTLSSYRDERAAPKRLSLPAEAELPHSGDEESRSPEQAPFGSVTFLICPSSDQAGDKSREEIMEQEASALGKALFDSGAVEKKAEFYFEPVGIESNGTRRFSRGAKWTFFNKTREFAPSESKRNIEGDVKKPKTR